MASCLNDYIYLDLLDMSNVCLLVGFCLVNRHIYIYIYTKGRSRYVYYMYIIHFLETYVESQVGLVGFHS